MDRLSRGKCPSGLLQSVRGAAAVTTHLCIPGLGWASVLNTYPEERCSKGMDGMVQILVAKMTGLMLEENYWSPQTVRFSLLAFLKV